MSEVAGSRLGQSSKITTEKETDKLSPKLRIAPLMTFRSLRKVLSGDLCCYPGNEHSSSNDNNCDYTLYLLSSRAICHQTYRRGNSLPQSFKQILILARFHLEKNKYLQMSHTIRFTRDPVRCAAGVGGQPRRLSSSHMHTCPRLWGQMFGRGRVGV